MQSWTKSAALLGLVCALSLEGFLGCGESAEPVPTGIDILRLDGVSSSLTANQMRVEQRRNGALELEIADGASDPFIRFAHSFDASTVEQIEVKVTGTLKKDVYFYWASRTGCRSMLERCKVVLRHQDDTGTWIAELDGHPWWRGEITQLRFDFDTPGGTPFVIDSIRLIAGDEPGATDATRQLGPPRVTATNMFNLALHKVLEIDLRKKGGGIGATSTELIVAAGDGQLRVVDLETFESSSPAITLPANNEAEALLHARSLEPPSFGSLAEEQVEARLRYDDVLVLDVGDERNLLVSYGHFDVARACFTHRVARFVASSSMRLAGITAGADDWAVLFESAPCFDIKRGGNVFAGHQSGGRLAVSSEEPTRVILALGDYEFDGWKDVPSYPQDSTADYGKMIEIDVATGASTTMSLGHRNPQGIFVDRVGTVWSTEHGPQGGDELNRIERGANYGWPVVTQGIMYGRRPWPFNPAQGRHAGFTRPTFAWVPSIGISNLDQSIGFHPLWEGDLLVFSLRDHSIFRLRMHDNRVQFVEQIALPHEEPIRYGLNHAATGSLYLWTDEGALYRATPDEDAWVFLDESEIQRREYEERRKARGE